MRERLNITDLERYGLKGSVLEIIHKEYEPKFSNDSTYTLELYDFLAPHNYKLEFNQNGNLNTRTELRKENDSLIAGAIWNYKYDQNKRILQEKRISYQYSKDTTIWNYEYKGDSIINVQQLDKTYKVLYYTYRQEGNFEYLNHANSDSSYITKKLFVYDNLNRLTRMEDYADKEFVQDMRISTYNDTISNNKFKEIVIWTKHDNSFYNEFEYDKNGNVITMIIGNFSEDKKSINRYEYIYDDRNNWIEKRHIGWRGKLSTVFKREIRYYEIPMI
ncbi:hypothetical protein GCM10007103_28740 [Salinimicrobium marinum]|uniref:Uncharacterized protein n=2 Tax=Salinimicrobium marinum TaxID=680283 RepID=A0A918SID2_9FLAO|nr:hypothetical protein GCM10007103_28740 [Salinimicrobium marinum]